MEGKKKNRESVMGRRDSVCKGPETGSLLALEELEGDQCGWSVVSKQKTTPEP